MTRTAGPKTLVEKIWDRHAIRELSDGRTLMHIDRHLLHDGTSRQAFDGLRRIGRPVRNRDLSFAVVDHIVSTLPGRTGESHPPGIERIHAAKDLILYFMARHGITAGTGCAVEYAGAAIRALPVEARMTICNMSIELGARFGIVAPDDRTIEYIAGRPFAPRGELWDRALAEWRNLYSDPDSRFEREFEIDCSRIAPQVTWGNTPQDTVAVDEALPDPAAAGDGERRKALERAYSYMDLAPGRTLEGVAIDYAFIGSCTNSRLSDLEAAARVVRGRKVAKGVTALAVPGSMAVKAAAEAAGLHRIFMEAGFEWRNAGCSMCVGSNGDLVPPGKRSISTTNRNFEHRQGPHSRTHLASPAMVAAAAVTGRITDVRRLLNES